MLIELKHDKMEANKTHFPFLFRRFLFTESPNMKAFKNIRRLEGHSHLYLFQENLSFNSFLFFPHMAHSHEGANNLPFPLVYSFDLCARKGVVSCQRTSLNRNLAISVSISPKHSC